MTPVLQTVIVALLVVAAAAYVGRRAWRTLRPAGKAGCGAGCGCGDGADGTDDWSRTR
jgi:hypothetical protein